MTAIPHIPHIQPLHQPLHQPLIANLRAMRAAAQPACRTDDGRWILNLRATADRMDDLLRAAAELDAMQTQAHAQAQEAAAGCASACSAASASAAALASSCTAAAGCQPGEAAAEGAAGSATSQPASLAQLEEDIQALAILMDEVGQRMCWHGGFGPLARHGHQLIVAAQVARGWVDGLRAPAPADQEVA